jgi:hypothetical protein
VTSVVLEHRVLDPFVDDAREAYRTCTPSAPPSCFAVILGCLSDVANVCRVELARNVRASDEIALDEFRSSIIPAFGRAYANEHRGFWCDPMDLLRISRIADAAGLEILGSIHLHPDWHRIGPPQERGLRISEEPTPMDAHMFCNTGWPINMIYYLAGTDHRFAAWAPPEDPLGTVCRPIGITWGTGR